MLTRRGLLAGAGGAALASSRPWAAQRALVPLWPDAPPGGGGPTGPVARGRGGGITNIANPYLEVFAPSYSNGIGVVIAGGGGYRSIQVEWEAYAPAAWLNARGITAFVLAYRLPGEGWTAGPHAPLQDAQRSVRMIRSRAAAYKIHPARIGVLGFSAGGHLCAMASARSAFRSYTPLDAVDELSARPDFTALAYPVITLERPYDNTSTRRVLIGENPTPEKTREWSVQTHVGRDCAPVFLVETANDPIAHPINGHIMRIACEAAGVPVEFHELPAGGHGFGMGFPGTPTAGWPDLLDRWLKKGAGKA